MNERREQAAVLALVRRGDRPWHHYSDLIEAAGSALAIATGDFEPPFYEPPRLFEPLTATTLDGTLDEIEAEIDEWHREGMSLVTVLDAGYPRNLRSTHDRPPFLFFRGDLAETNSRSIAIVGTRKPSPDGLEAAARFARGLADAGYVIVSGLADGVDAAVHWAALDAAGRTVAVIGNGLRRVYPAANRELQEQIALTGAVVSQFWPDAPPTKRTFPLRNRVMSGFALATVVIEASNTSGARMQARFALQHGRPVFLLESLLEYEWAQRYSSRGGAHLVSEPAEVARHVERLQAVDTLTL
ncbi:MAG: DNA-processing protein DprA [Gaiellaceae bacterium]